MKNFTPSIPSSSIVLYFLDERGWSLYGSEPSFLCAIKELQKCVEISRSLGGSAKIEIREVENQGKCWAVTDKGQIKLVAIKRS